MNEYDDDCYYIPPRSRNLPLSKKAQLQLLSLGLALLAGVCFIAWKVLER